MEDVDYVAARTALAGILGGLSGASLAIIRGHSVPMLMQRMAGSWAMAATACIGTQRITHAAARHLLAGRGIDEKSDAMIVGTHCAGGVVGGGILGYLFIRKPLHGISYLTPIMLLVSLAEIRYEERKRLGPSIDEGPAVTRAIDGSLIDPPKKA